MTEREYNEHLGIRRSDLWLMNDSPEKFRYHMDNPDEESSPALIFGSAAHKAVLEAEDFDTEYAIAPSVDRRTKAGKEEWVAFVEQNAGKQVIDIGTFETISEMRKKIEMEQLARRLLLDVNGQTEAPLFWTDQETGEECKVKCDRLIQDDDGKYVVVDYKTAKTAQTDRFNTEIFRLGYHVQAAMYTDGVKNALGLSYRPGFIFVVQEKAAPYSVNVIEVGEDVMGYGDAEFHRLLQLYHDCKEADIWEGYIQGGMTNEAYLPGYLSIGEEED